MFAKNQPLFKLELIPPSRLHVLDNMLQLYAHELNGYFNYAITLDNNGRYRIKSAEKCLENGWGYFIVVRHEYAGFILLNKKTKSHGGTFINEFFILPRYRKGLFCQNVISALLSGLSGIVEFRVLKKNKRVLTLFDTLARRYTKSFIKMDEHENGSEHTRFIFDTADVVHDISEAKHET